MIVGAIGAVVILFLLVGDDIIDYFKERDKLKYSHGKDCCCRKGGCANNKGL